MRLTINVDLTPEEARAFFGMPDVAPLNEMIVAEMMARYNKGACPAFDYQGYWSNAVANGAAMCGLLDEFDIGPRHADDAFMTGLVSGIGWLTIAETFPDLMSQYLERCQGADPITKSRAYQAIFPCRLPLVSERYLERWATTIEKLAKEPNLTPAVRKAGS